MRAGLRTTGGARLSDGRISVVGNEFTAIPEHLISSHRRTATTGLPLKIEIPRDLPPLITGEIVEVRLFPLTP